jgi:hypothetical protein
MTTIQLAQFRSSVRTRPGTKTRQTASRSRKTPLGNTRQYRPLLPRANREGDSHDYERKPPKRITVRNRTELDPQESEHRRYGEPQDKLSSGSCRGHGVVRQSNHSPSNVVFSCVRNPCTSKGRDRQLQNWVMEPTADTTLFEGVVSFRLRSTQLLIETLGEEYLKKRLIWNISLVGQSLQLGQHHGGET